MKEGQARAERLVRYDNECVFVRFFVCASDGAIAGGNIQARRRSEIYRFIKSFSLHPTCNHSHTHTCTHTHRAHTLPALTIHLSTLFYSFYQEYCSYTFPALPSFLLHHAQSGKTGQPYLFSSKKSFVIIIIFQS